MRIFAICTLLIFQSVAQSSAHAADLRGWVGTWKNGDNEIRLSLRKGKIQGDGEASRGSNVGEFHGSALPRNGRLTIRDDYGIDDVVCEVIMVRSGNSLTVLNHDPDCGGYGVSFKGVYHRQIRHR